MPSGQSVAGVPEKNNEIYKGFKIIKMVTTGKSFSEALILASVIHNMTRDCSLNSAKNTSSQHIVYKNCFVCLFHIQNNICTQHVVNLYFP